MNYPSKIVEEAVLELSKLPSIGQKTALRLSLFLLKQPETVVTQIGQAIINLKTKVQFCKKCHNLADEELCYICVNPKREASQICVLEDTRDVFAIENTQSFSGLYHLLGGVLNPIQGIGPDKLNIESLLKRIELETVTEVIFALSATIEGDTTVHFIAKQIKEMNPNVKITSISRGIPVGGELEFVDEITLARSLNSRIVL